MKEAYYFSHDSNARNDKKILDMLSVYGAEGYGWYWMLVEMMRDATDYKLDMQSKYSFNAFAMQLHADSTKIKEFITDCINEFGLFESDGAFFWSNSLLRRMEKKKKVSESRSNAANKRWSNANASKNDADAMQNDAKESKEKESKGKEIESSTTTDDELGKIEKAYSEIHQCFGIKPKEWPLVNSFLNKGVSSDLIIEVMKEKHAKKVEEGGKVNSFSFYTNAINERFDQSIKQEGRLDFLDDL